MFTYDPILFNHGRNRQHCIRDEHGRIVESAVCGTYDSRDLLLEHRFEQKVKELNATAPVSA